MNWTSLKWPAIAGFAITTVWFVVRGVAEEYVFSSLTAELQRHGGLLGDFLAWSWSPLILGVWIFGGILAIASVRDERQATPAHLPTLADSRLKRARIRPASPTDVVDELSELIEQGDAYAQTLMLGSGKPKPKVYEDWAELAEGILEARLGRSAVTDFRVARRPDKRASGAYTSEIWRQLDRAMAQVEVLQHLKREVESVPVYIHPNET